MSEVIELLKRAVDILEYPNLADMDVSYKNDLKKDIIEYLRSTSVTVKLPDTKVLNGVAIGSGWFKWNDGRKCVCVVTHFHEDLIYANMFIDSKREPTSISCNKAYWYDYFEVIPGYKF